ncbi:MAG: hypothetical protein ACOCVR_01350 [Myxococcota bacterium]
MLDAFIIEEIKRQEEERRREEDRRPTIPLPLEDDDLGPSPRQSGDEGEVDRGVVIIDYSA